MAAASRVLGGGARAAKPPTQGVERRERRPAPSPKPGRAEAPLLLPLLLLLQVEQLFRDCSQVQTVWTPDSSYRWVHAQVRAHCPAHVLAHRPALLLHAG